MKKTIIATLSILLLASLGMAEKQDLSKFDGNDWRTWDLSRRYNFVTGFMAGTLYVIEENLTSGTYAGKDYDSEKAWQAMLAYYEAESQPSEKGSKVPPKKKQFGKNEISLMLEFGDRNRNESLFRYQIAEITNSQIVDGLNIFYEDFRNRQIKIKEAIYVTKKQIEGASTQEIEALTEWLRTPDREFNKRFYKDKDDKRKYIRFP